jgi:hypothetical protein
MRFPLEKVCVAQGDKDRDKGYGRLGQIRSKRIWEIKSESAGGASCARVWQSRILHGI